ncbi:MAG: septum formation initiator family protein [Bacteroidales bacterium]|nr:septum formation initiator family protein [Bacteroidales bacterium]
MPLFRNISDFIKNAKQNSALVRVLLNKWTIAALVFIVITGVIDRNNIKVLFKTNATLRAQHREELQLRENIRTTDEKIQQLKSNLDTLEMFARENYYFLEDGEDVYIVEEGKSSKKTK